MEAEQAYSRLCNKCRAVAVIDNKPIAYRWLQSLIASPEEHFLQEMKAHGWTDEHLRQMKNVTGKTNDIAKRLVGSVGRLVCSPTFCAELEKLRRQWDSLPSDCRPRLPLARSMKVAHFVDGIQPVALTQEQTDFARAFDCFCDTWRICGMTTWDLPDVDGPKWPQPDLKSERQLSGRLTYDTPWHFRLLKEDGLGDLLRQEYEQVANLKGVDDLKKSCTYGHLFQIDFWDKVINRRYVDSPRRRGFVTAFTAIIAEIVNLDTERVQKLRKWRSALQGGKFRSLTGKR
jgi:hypothetical protein